MPIVASSTDFLRELKNLSSAAPKASVPDAVFMVSPENFHVATESAVDNPYLDLATRADPERAARQAEQLACLIEGTGIEVKRFPGLKDQPDGVFPNNVFATTPGQLVVGSMFHPGRRAEAERKDIRDWFAREKGYSLTDLSTMDLVAELTGPMILDRGRGIGFCGMTSRVDEAGLDAMHQAFSLRLTYVFNLQAGEYHTNVVMSVLAGRACVLHPDSFTDPDVPVAISAAYPGKTLFLDNAEKNAFAANCIALSDRDLFMSQRGADALRPASRAELESWGFRLHTTDLDEIEKAGGSLRCMVAEDFGT